MVRVENSLVCRKFIKMTLEEKKRIPKWWAINYSLNKASEGRRELFAQLSRVKSFRMISNKVYENFPLPVFQEKIGKRIFDLLSYDLLSRKFLKWNYFRVSFLKKIFCHELHNEVKWKDTSKGKCLFLNKVKWNGRVSCNNNVQKYLCF